MCSRRLEESRKKMRFKFVFEPVHMIDSTDTARQLIPKMKPSHRKGTIARLFFGTRDLKCNGQIQTETVFSFVDTRLRIEYMLFFSIITKSFGPKTDLLWQTWKCM